MALCFKKISGILFSFILCVAFSSTAQIKFQRTYGGNLINEGRSVKQTLDGGYIIAGSTSSFGYGSMDVLLIKTDSLGNGEFMRTYGGSNVDQGFSVLQLSDSGYVVAGYTNSFGNGGYDAYLIRTDKNGDTLWTKTYGGADWDFVYSLKQASDGGFVMAGNTYSYGTGGSQAWILKVDENGTLEWSKELSISTESFLNAIIQTTQNDYVATGYHTGGIASSNDILVVKLNSTGDSIWSHSFGDSLADEGTSLDLVDSNNYIIGSTLTNVDSNRTDFYLLKIDTSGNEEWHQEFHSTHGDFLYSIHHLDNGGYVVCGWTNNNFGNGQDVSLITTDDNGGFVIGRTYGCLGNDVAYDLNKCEDKGFIIVGESNSFGPGIESVYFIKTDSAGETKNGCDSVMISLNEFINDNLNVVCYPNPASDFMHLRFNKVNISTSENAAINIFNLSGQSIFTLNVNFDQLTEKDFVINIRNFENGCYLLSVVSDHINFKNKILIAR